MEAGQFDCERSRFSVSKKFKTAKEESNRRSTRKGNGRNIVAEYALAKGANYCKRQTVENRSKASDKIIR